MHRIKMKKDSYPGFGCHIGFAGSSSSPSVLPSFVRSLAHRRSAIGIVCSNLYLEEETHEVAHTCCDRLPADTRGSSLPSSQ